MKIAKNVALDIERLAAVLALSLVGCIENKEEIVVRRDGSLVVQMSAKGSSEDLSKGYPIALDGPWHGDDETTLDWVRTVGPDTGSEATVRRVAEGAWAAQGDTRLAVTGEFRSAADLPRYLAPQAEPYRTAYLERDTRLTVEAKSGGTLYTFERTFGARRWIDRAVLARLEEKVSEDVRQRLNDQQPLTDEQWRAVTPIVADDYERSALAFAREALGSVYLDGEANLSTRSFEACLAAVARDVRARITESKLREIYAAILDQVDHPGFEQDVTLNPDLIVRDAIRRSITAALAGAEIADATRNAVHERLEQAFTAFDATGDLQDESFEVSVEMPGTVVLGNYDELDGSRATWSIKGENLNDHSAVLKVVSIVQ